MILRSYTFLVFKNPLAVYFERMEKIILALDQSTTGQPFVCSIIRPKYRHRKSGAPADLSEAGFGGA